MRGMRPSLTSGVVAVCALVALGSAAGDPVHGKGFATIDEKDLRAHVVFLASPELEGRDTPSAGLERAAEYAALRFRAAGLEDIAGKTEGYLWTYEQERAFPDVPIAIPLPEGCELTFRSEVAGEQQVFTYGQDYVPVPGGGGKGIGEPIFLGFGIDSEKEPYNDLKGTAWRGKVAVILEGEPRHKRMFDGEELTSEGDLYRKLERLEEGGVVGVLVVRRPPALDRKREPLEATPLSFRHTWANFEEHEPPVVRPFRIPALEISAAAAERIVGQDVLLLAEDMDKRAKPVRVELPGREVVVASSSRTGKVQVNNVVGVLRGSDPALAEQYVVIGAHYDHLGVDPWGRIGMGADDNASGTAAVLELVDAFAVARPARSILAVLFAGEEDGLLGSRAFCANPPVPVEQMVLMLNADMLGQGEAAEVLVLGVDRNPALEDVIERAQKLAQTRIKKVVTNRGVELFERSDHFPFHQAGVPALFFFEGWPMTNNKDYHIYTDTIERLDLDKVTRSVRLMFNVAWIVANDAERPPRPR